MRQQNNQYRVRDTTLLSGWLFADLLLGLMVIFLVGIPRILPPPKIPPVLTVDPTSLDPINAHCTGGITKPQCTVTVGETASSQGNVSWTTSSDMSGTVAFSPATGVLSPGQSVNVTISAIPCQNGSLIFHGSDNASPAIVIWQCTPLPERLERTYCRLVLNDQDPDQFSKDSKFAMSVLEPQINALKFLQGRQVGIAIANGGVDNINSPDDRDRGVNIARNTYLVLKDLANQGSLFKKTSYYDPLFTAFYPAKNAVIDIYLVIRQDNPVDTCDPQNHNPI